MTFTTQEILYAQKGEVAKQLNAMLKQVDSNNPAEVDKFIRTAQTMVDSIKEPTAYEIRKRRAAKRRMQKAKRERKAYIDTALSILDE